MSNGLALALLAAAFSGCGSDGALPDFDIETEEIWDHGVQPQWSPDGTRVAFVGTSPQGTRAIHVLDVTSRAVTCLTCGMKKSAVKPSWSPDSRWILFTSTEDFEGSSILEEQEVYAVRADGTGLSRLTFAVGDDRLAYFSPDGRKVLWSTLRNNLQEMVLADFVEDGSGARLENLRVLNPPDLDTSDPIRLEESLAIYEAKGFTPDGQSVVLAYTSESLNGDVFTLDLETRALTRITDHPEWDEGAAFSPDGRLVAYESTRAYRQIRAFSLLPLPRYQNIAIIAPLTYLALGLDAFPLTVEVWVTDAEGREHRRISVTGEDGYSFNGQPFWHPDGTAIVYSESIGGDSSGGAVPPSRIRLARLKGYTPGPKILAQPTPTPAWAPPLENLGPLAVERTVVGKVAGSIELRLKGTLIEMESYAVYDRFSNDGKTYTTGVLDLATSLTKLSGRLAGDLTLEGEESGRLQSDLEMMGPLLKGGFTSAWGNETFTCAAKGAGKLDCRL